MTTQHSPTDTGAWSWADPAVCSREQEPHPNICNKTTGKCLLGTSQNKTQPGFSGEVFWPQISPLLLTVIGVEGRALCPNWPLDFPCCVTCSCSAQAQIMWIRSPSTREGVPTPGYTFQLWSLQHCNNRKFCVVGTGSISAWWTPDTWISPLERCLGASGGCLINWTNLHLTCSHTNFHTSCLRRKRPWGPWRYDNSQHVTTSLKLSIFINMIHLKHLKEQPHWV